MRKQWNSLINLYNEQQSAVKFECGITDGFHVGKDVRQSCIFSVSKRDDGIGACDQLGSLGQLIRGSQNEKVMDSVSV